MAASSPSPAERRSRGAVGPVLRRLGLRQVPRLRLHARMLRQRGRRTGQRRESRLVVRWSQQVAGQRWHVSLFCRRQPRLRLPAPHGLQRHGQGARMGAHRGLRARREAPLPRCRHLHRRLTAGLLRRDYRQPEGRRSLAERTSLLRRGRPVRARRHTSDRGQQYALRGSCSVFKASSGATLAARPRTAGTADTTASGDCDAHADPGGDAPAQPAVFADAVRGV